MDTAFAWKTAPDRAADKNTLGMDVEGGSGLLDGTLIATVSGWRRVENLRPGDLVQTLDCGPVRLLEREELTSQGCGACPTQAPRLVPAGVLGNRAPMRLMAGQGVLLETPHAEAYCGDHFALVPVAALDGYGGIAPVPPSLRTRFWRLHFEQSQVLCAEGDALVFCPAKPRRSAPTMPPKIAACGRSAVAAGSTAPAYQPLSAAAAMGLLRDICCAPA